MNGEDRKAAMAAYRERKALAGIFAVRCTASGECWVGRTLDLGQVENRVRFTLRHGGIAPAGLLAACRRHGPEGFTIDAVEMLEEENLAYVRDRLLKDRLTHWRNALGADLL